MRKDIFLKHEIYHIYQTGTQNTEIFLDDEDKTRFLFLILHLQSPNIINNTNWYTQTFLRKKEFRISDKKIKQILEDRQIKLMAFSITKTRFDLLLQNLEEMVVSVYMQRVLTAYSKYFNAKYKRKGHVFNGPFISKHISNKTDLINTSVFIHRIEDLNTNSLSDYLYKNKWGELLSINLLKTQINDTNKYKELALNYKEN